MWILSCSFFLLLTINTNVHLSPVIQNVSGSAYTVPRVWLTVSSVVDIVNGSMANNPHAVNSSVVRAVEVRWMSTQEGPLQGDLIEVYRLEGSQPIRTYQLPYGNPIFSGYMKTNIEFPHHTEAELDSWISQSIPKSHPTKHGVISGQCLHFYVVYISKNQTQSMNCIKLNPRWMEQDYSILKDKTIEEIMIPGTHDATSFDPYNISFYETDWTGRFQYTQDENLYSQLAYGIRYFDMRVAAYNDSQDASTSIANETYWMVHGPWPTHITLREAFRQIRRFLERTTHELLIVDFHGFENGFENGINKEKDESVLKIRLQNWYKVVIEELEKYLIPYQANRHATIDEMVKSGKRVILGYFYKRDPRNLFDSDLLWPHVEHLWASTDKFEKLVTYMETKVCNRTHSDSRIGAGIHLQSMQAELTPTLEGKLTLRYHGLRELAELVNMNFDHWFRQLYWKCTNIVSPDFFLGSDVVQIAIDVNRRRFGNETVYGTLSFH